MFLSLDNFLLNHRAQTKIMLWILILTWIVCIFIVWVFVKVVKPTNVEKPLPRKYRIILWIFIGYLIIFVRFGFLPEVEASVKTVLIVLIFLLCKLFEARCNRTGLP